MYTEQLKYDNTDFSTVKKFSSETEIWAIKTKKSSLK